jgi:hypothetical protein
MVFTIGGSMKAQKAEDYVRHEAGHLVAAKVLNFQTGKIVLRASQAEAEIILNPRLPDVAAATDFMRRRVQVLYAGALAQSLEKGRATPAMANVFLDSTAINDHAKVRELVRIVVAMEHPEVTDDVFATTLLQVAEELYLAAQKIVERQSTVIEGITEEFIRAKRAARNPQVFELPKQAIDYLPAVRSLQENAGNP